LPLPVSFNWSEEAWNGGLLKTSTPTAGLCEQRFQQAAGEYTYPARRGTVRETMAAVLYRKGRESGVVEEVNGQQERSWRSFLLDVRLDGAGNSRIARQLTWISHPLT